MRRPNRAMRRTLVLAATLCALTFAGCSSDNSETPSVDITGTWRVQSLDYREFKSDGSYRIGLTESMENAVVDQGEYSVDGAVLRQSSSGESAVCANGETATFTIESLDDGANGEERILLVHDDDQCARRAAEGDLTLIRLK